MLNLCNRGLPEHVLIASMGIRKNLLYALSLPERALRSTAAAVGGVSKLMTDTLLPRSVRKLTFYRYFIGNTQKFVVESLGGVQTGEEKLADDFLARKIVGNVADAAGIFAFHFSPLWFFALVGDAAGGTRTYLNRIVAELKADGALRPDAEIPSVDALLEALARTSSTSAQPLDTPPLSQKDLAKLKDELRIAYGEVYRKSKDALPPLDRLWAGLMEVRRREAIPLLKLSGAMAFAATRAVGRASGGLFHEKVVASYAHSLSEVRAEGFARFFARAARPYLDAVAGAFSTSKKSLTERLFGG
jgi:hypothetical protein